MAKYEFTTAQLNKLRNLETSDWHALLALLDEGGSGEYRPDLSRLLDLKLIRKVGPSCSVVFHVDGIVPFCGVAKTKKDSADGIRTFVAICQAASFKLIRTGKDMGALKRFVSNYSAEEFERMVKSYVAVAVDPSLHGMWGARKYYDISYTKSEFSDYHDE